MSCLEILFLTSICIIIGLIIIVLILFFSPSHIISSLSAPPVPTPKEEIKAALKAAEAQKENKLIDLGSGTGRVLTVAEEEFNLQAVGIEQSLPMIVISKLLLFFKHSKSEVRKEDLLKTKTNLQNYDIVYTYLSGNLMKKLEKEMATKNLNVKLVSYCFSFPNIEPEKTIQSPRQKNIYIYNI